MESYKRDLEFSPSLAALMQAALREYLRQRGYVAQDGEADPRPTMYEDAPFLRGDKTAAEMVLEDRR